MSKEAQKSNFELAQEEANKIDLQIIDTLQKGYNFRVEAGAGSGKTYSLNKVIEWIQVNKWKQYRKKNQHVVYPQDKEAAYIRNRNLFYVCCSRPKKRLYFFVSVPVDRVFRKFLAEMVGEDNILTYSEFLNSQNHSKTE